MDRRSFLTRCGTLAASLASSRGIAGRAGELKRDRTVPASGPLRVSARNPRYFCNAAEKEVLLVGAHTWNNLVDMGKSDPPASFDFPAYLVFLQRYGHNFIRMWTWDSTVWDTRANGKWRKDFVHHAAPHPWPRTGPGNALDGKARFDLSRFNEAYFDRLRSRVAAAGRLGIYVSVMLFEGWGMMHGNRRRGAIDQWAWKNHPFHPDNNVNGVDAQGKVHSRSVPSVNEYQSRYVRKVVDTVNDLDNVLYEVINEGGEKEWDWWVVDLVHQYEKTKAKRHPVGITGHGAEYLPSMLASPADWISPGSRDGFRDDPPAWDGRKVSLLDTDHVWGIGGDGPWVWKSLLRGHNPLFMDPYDGSVLDGEFDPRWEPVRRNLGHAREVSRQLPLAAMVPHDRLASTGFCLAEPGKVYLAWAPGGKPLEVDLSATRGMLQCQWINASTGRRAASAPVQGGARRRLQPPQAADSLVLLQRK